MVSAASDGEMITVYLSDDIQCSRSEVDECEVEIRLGWVG